MKTAISIPDKIFSKAERYAKNNGISRSQLFTQAVEHFVANNELHTVTEKLNQVYSNTSEKLNNELSEMQFSSLQNEEW